MDKELDKSKSKELGPQISLTANEQAAMMGGLGQDDITIPQLVTLEGLSPEVTKDKAGFPGDLFLKVLNRNFKEGPIEVIPLFRFKTRARFAPKQEGGGLLCRSKDAKTGVGEPGGDCSLCSKAVWGQDPVTKKSIKPECNESHNVIVLLRQDEDKFPVAISGSRTRLKALKNWNSLMLMNTQGGRPLFAKSYLVKSKVVSNAGGQESHTFDVTVGNSNAPLPAEEQKMAKEWFDRLIGANIVVGEEVAEPTHVEKEGF